MQDSIQGNHFELLLAENSCQFTWKDNRSSSETNECSFTVVSIHSFLLKPFI